ncbi:MAG: DNA translocase FtsK 4TM domain-containing protein, partial [Gemmatimonadaceae bacterium]
MRESTRRELTGIALLLVAVFLGGALLVPLPEGVSCTDVRGVFGPVGACLKWMLWSSIGGPGAILLPVAAAVHALRLFGRLQSSTDRSWLVFLFGAAVLVPIVAGLASGAPREATAVAGVWGNFVAFYLTGALGVVGAWIAIALAGSALMAITLRWNPIRMLVGPTPPRPAKPATSATLAAQLEPAPEDMPAIEQGVSSATAPLGEGKRAVGGEGRPRRRVAPVMVEDQGTLDLVFPLGDV